MGESILISMARANGTLQVNIAQIKHSFNMKVLIFLIFQYKNIHYGYSKAKVLLMSTHNINIHAEYSKCPKILNIKVSDKGRMSINAFCCHGNHSLDWICPKS